MIAMLVLTVLLTFVAVQVIAGAGARRRAARIGRTLPALRGAVRAAEREAAAAGRAYPPRREVRIPGLELRLPQRGGV